MKKRMTWIGFVVLLGACAGGEDDNDTMADTTSGSVGESGSESSGATDVTTTMTSAPTTAETLSTTMSMTTDESETAESSSGESGTETSTGDVTCEEYCSVYNDSCVDHTEYANEQDCLDNCAQWPIGTAADTAGDSVGCRIYHATVAASTDPAVHCLHAGPSGDGTCVAEGAPTCDVYCMRYFENCQNELNAFADEAECMSECSDWYAGTFKDTAGHTIGCHTYHAQAAAAGPEKHCPHAGPGGGGICVL